MRVGAMYDATKTLLPATATDLAQALDLLEERLFDLPVEMITKDPWHVPVSLLDHLAWEHSVDVWDREWSESIKRNVIAAAAEVQAYKGTPYAIKKALAALGVRIELLEWFDSDGATPGTFTVTVYARSNLSTNKAAFINKQMVKTLNAVISANKPVSRSFTMFVGSLLRPEPMHIAMRIQSLSIIRIRLNKIQAPRNV